MNKKLLTTFLISAGLASGLAFNATQVNAAAIKGIVTTNKMARLYDENGKMAADRALAPNTPWITDTNSQLPDVGEAYRVSTHEFVKAEDVSFQHGHAASGVINTGANGALIYHYENGTYTASDSKLDANSKWQYSYTDENAGKTWYQVATNSWINSDDASTATTISNTGTAEISYAPDAGTDIWNGYGANKTVTGQKLANGSKWRFSQKVIDANGDAWYQIGTSQWISGYFTKITNGSFDEAAAKIWDPNYAALKVTKKTAIYSDSNYNSAGNKTMAEGSIVQVDSTVQTGNTIWYEMSEGGWLPSSATSTINAQRPTVALNGKTKAQAIDDVISTAKQQLGKPYVWNAKGPDSYDCSGLMQYVFRQATGQNIGSWTVPQETAGTKVSMNNLQRGDLVFWGPEGASYHVALYLGNNEYLNALRPGTNVKIDKISSSFEPSFGVRIFQ
ncbi:C40 family peptidase [Companilactobacillus kimchiensis]|nr:C40 family peptidase [Companilactobacillus kimchiensis]